MCGGFEVFGVFLLFAWVLVLGVFGLDWRVVVAGGCLVVVCAIAG